MRYFDFPANLRIIDRLSEPKLLSMDWRHNRPFRIALLLCVTLAALAGIGLYGGTMLEGAIGTLASAHVFSTYPELAFGTELFGPLLLTEEIMAEPLPYRDFMLHLPQKPGLGIEVDKEKVYRLSKT